MISTVEKLRDNCTIALGEFRGNYNGVSERTIRDDIRVMKSEMLGFNAPIVVSDGKYYYSDETYSIFSTPLTENNLLKDILKLLLEERKNIADTEVDSLLLRISSIVGEPIPTKKKPIQNISHEVIESESDIRFSKVAKASEDSEIRFVSRKREHLSDQSKSKEPLSSYNNLKTLLWREILEVLY